MSTCACVHVCVCAQVVCVGVGKRRKNMKRHIRKGKGYVAGI